MDVLAAQDLVDRSIRRTVTPDPPSEFSRFPSRRSVVHSINGMVACSQPLAAQAGIQILMEGGNAADAAVAVAAALNVTEPGSTGIGGDMFCLYFDPKTKKVHSLNGSGRSPSALTRDVVFASIPKEEIAKHGNRIPSSHAHAVTVPGAAAGWCDTVEKFGSGKVTLEQILAPAIALAEDGFPVGAISAMLWRDGVDILKNGGPNSGELLLGVEGRAPEEGDFIRLPGLANTFRELAKNGKKGFYEGQVAEAIVKAVQEKGGVLTLDDLKKHAEIGSEEMEPINIEVPWGSKESGMKKLWECAPNGQGLVALQSLGILKALESTGAIPPIGTSSYSHNSTEYLHALITALRLAFSDAHDFIRDPSLDHGPEIPLKGLLSKEYLETRSKVFSPTEAVPGGKIPHGTPPAYTECDTVYFAVADRYGGGCSFINSVFSDFGSGIIPKGYSFPLHNRGCGFLLATTNPSSPQPSPNLLEPNKRPYHTIIPALITSPAGELDTVFGVMGAYMQPQGHAQVLLNLLAFGMSPQEALDAPRICLASAAIPGEVGRFNSTAGVKVLLEEGVSEEVAEGLRRLGYVVQWQRGWERKVFGRGQCIRVKSVDGGDGKGGEGGKKVRVLSGGSDLRGDGCCVGY